MSNKLDSRDVAVSLVGLIGGQFWGMLVMAVIQGINTVEFIRYMTTYTSEPLTRYLAVVPAFTIHVIQTITVFVWTHELLVKGYGDMSILIGHGPLLDMQAVLTGTGMFIVQVYYAKRLWALRQKPKWLLIYFSILLPAGWAFSVIGTYSSIQAPSFPNFFMINYQVVQDFEARWKPFRMTQAGLNVLADISISGGMLLTLLKARSKGDTVTQTLVRRLIRLVFDTMLLPTVVIILVTAMHLVYGDADSKERLFGYPQTGINVFSLLHTLLVRQDLQRLIDSQAEPSLSLYRSPLHPLPSEGRVRVPEPRSSHTDSTTLGTMKRFGKTKQGSSNYLSTADAVESGEGLSRLDSGMSEKRPLSGGSVSFGESSSHERSLNRYSIGPEHDDKLRPRLTPTVSYEMDRFRIHSPPNVYRPLEDATLRANVPGIARRTTFDQEVQAIRIYHRTKSEGDRRRSWD